MQRKNVINNVLNVIIIKNEMDWRHLKYLKFYRLGLSITLVADTSDAGSSPHAAK